MDRLELSDILKGLPGISSVEGTNLHENCVVKLHRHKHSSSTTLKLSGERDVDVSLVWTDSFDDVLDRTYADRQCSIERSAVCINVLLALKLTDYTVIERSRKGTGLIICLAIKTTSFIPPRLVWKYRVSARENVPIH